MWLYYLRAHDIWYSSWHALLFILAVTLGTATFLKTKWALCNHPSGGNYAMWIYERHTMPRLICCAVVLFVIVVGASRFVIGLSSSQSDLQGMPTAQLAGFRLFLDISHSQISGKPVGWNDPLGDGIRNEDLVARDTTNRELNLGPDGNDVGTVPAERLGGQFNWRAEYREAVWSSLIASGIERTDVSGRDLRHVQAIGTFLATANLREARLNGANLENADLRATDLTGARVENANLSGVRLEGSRLTRARLDGAILVDANLTGVEAIDVCLGPASMRAKSGLDRRSAVLVGANLTRADLTGADLTMAAMFDARLENADMANANLSNASFVLARLADANLTGAILSGTNLSKATLVGADLSCTHLSGGEMSKVKRDDCPIYRRRLADPCGVRDTTDTLLSPKKADLNGANLTDARITNAQLPKAQLAGATLTDANLSGSNFSSADLSNAVLHRAVLTGTQLAGAVLDNADFSGADLGTAQGLVQSQLDAACGNTETTPPNKSDGTGRMHLKTCHQPLTMTEVNR